MNKVTNDEATSFSQGSQAEKTLKKSWITPDVEVLSVPNLTKSGPQPGLVEDFFYTS